MGLSRRFLNLIVNDSIPGTRSLRRIDLTRNEFFYQDTPPPSAASTMEKIRLPRPTGSFRTSNIVSCSTLSDRKVFCAGRCGDAFIYDADTRHVVTMPNRPKWEPISIFVPSAGAGDGDPDPDGTLFLMERRPKQEGVRSGWRSDQFEAFEYRRSSKTSPSKSWHHQLLPLPPFLRDSDSKYRRFQYEIRSYGVLDGGSHIFISAEGLKPHEQRYGKPVLSSVAVTYCLDTVKHTWSVVGAWELPFQGKVEYVPELKLWFGISDEYAMDSDSEPCVLDGTRSEDLELDETPMDSDSEPSWNSERDGTSNEDLEFDETPNKERQKLQNSHSQVVQLGSGRFCIPSSSHTMGINRTWLGAADLSTMDSKPPLVRTWDLDLDDTSKDDLLPDETPNKEWQELQQSQLVHLGSGRFCIASSFHTMGIIRTCLGNELTFKRSAVFTGVEVMPPSNGPGEVQMVQHKSKCASDDNSIDVVF